MEKLKINKQKHPNNSFQKRFDQIVGLDSAKEELLRNLQLFFKPDLLQKWQNQHHPNGLPLMDRFQVPSLFLLSGDVGCGKTEIAQTIASPLAKRLGREIMVFETPTDLRGSAMVGGVSGRIRMAFSEAKRMLKKENPGILIIDEADDLATRRSQEQAHHEDRAGVNVLIREIDQLSRENASLAVILITNRKDAIDPAVVRRAAVQIDFSRPEGKHLDLVIERLFSGLVSQSEQRFLLKTCSEKQPRFTYSDLVMGVARAALLMAWEKHEPLSFKFIEEAVSKTNPSPELL